MTVDGGTPAEVSPGLVEAALQNLVNQFARPLECLRELVQNAIDAGSPRVRVEVEHAPSSDGPGLLAITVQDSGEGMDEGVIETRLTRMFASSKEDDLTKIGRFGIGFTSVFAIEPELVQVRTGRLGEGWELLFHPDRTYELQRLERPLRGTTVRLIKRLPAEEAPRWARECREVLAFWCAHSETPIVFVDRTEASPAPAAPPVETTDPDPFAAFNEPGLAPIEEGTLISRPLSLDAELVVDRREGPVHALVGTGARAQYGWFNGGLTLLSTRSTGCLGPAASRLAHLRIKVKSDRLEHTLTRDNVIMDEHWAQALGVVRAAADELSKTLLAAHESLARQADPPPSGALDRSLALLAQELKAGGLSAGQLRRAVVLPRHGGPPLPLRQLERQRGRLGLWLVASGRAGLDRAVVRAGWTLLAGGPGLQAFLDAWEGTAGRVLGADALWCHPRPVPAPLLPPAEAQLCQLVGSLLQSIGLELDPVICELGERGGDRLAWLGVAEGELVRTGGLSERGLWQRMRARLGARSRLWIDRRHPLWQGWSGHGPDLPMLAAYAVTQLILRECDLEQGGRAAGLEHAAAQLLDAPP